MTAIEPDITYRAVAEELRPEIREAIEVSIPCQPLMEGGHMWSEETTYIDSMAGLQRIIKQWRCALCGIHASDDPRPFGSYARLVEKGLW